MKAASNDNEELPFVSIGLASALILNKLRLATQLEAHKQEHQKEHDDRAGRAEAKEDSSGDNEYVLQRLKDLARFERQARGK